MTNRWYGEPLRHGQSGKRTYSSPLIALTMDSDRSVEEVNGELAEALGLFVLSDANLYEAASAAGVSRWELEEAIDRNGLAEPLGLDETGDISATIDELLDES